MLRLSSITRDLTLHAQETRLEPALGREKETFALLQLLGRKNAKSILIVGEPGVGKTRFVQGLAVAGARSSTGEAGLNFRVLELNLPAFLPARQDASESLNSLIDFLRTSSDTTLFIDDIHLVLLPERGGDNASLAASMLVPTIKKGEIRCVGALSTHDFETLNKVDPDLVQEFEVIRLEALSEAATLKLLEKISSDLELHHGVAIASDAREAAVTLSVKCMPNVKLPGKAIDVLDQACARYKLKLVAKEKYPTMVDQESMLKLGKRVGAHDVKRVIKEITAVDVDKELATEWQGKLEARLKRVMPGYDGAVAALSEAMARVRMNLDAAKPIGGAILLAGNGDVEVVKLLQTLAQQLFGKTDNLLVHDASQIVDADTVLKLFGLNGAREGSALLSAVETQTLSILAFTNIEKADVSLFDVLLPIMLTGGLRLPSGRLVNFRRSLIVLATGNGARIDGNVDKILGGQIMRCFVAKIPVATGPAH